MNNHVWFFYFLEYWSNTQAFPFHFGSHVTNFGSCNMMQWLKFGKEKLCSQMTFALHVKWWATTWSNSRKGAFFWPQFETISNLWWTFFFFLKKYLLVAVGEDASPSVDVVMGLVSVMVRVTGRTALWWGEGAKTGVKWPGTFPTTWPLLLGYKTKPKECLVKHTHCV